MVVAGDNTQSGSRNDKFQNSGCYFMSQDCPGMNNNIYFFADIQDLVGNGPY